MQEPNRKLLGESLLNSFEKKWLNIFKEFACKHNGDAGIAGWSFTGLQTRLRNFDRALQKHPIRGFLWMDVGCGAGTYARFLNEFGIKVIGIDYSFPTIQKAVNRDKGINRYIVGDGKRLPCKKEAFDGALCFGVIQTLEDSRHIVKELDQAIKDGGVLWIDALNGWSLPHLWDRFCRKVQNRPLHLRYEYPNRLKKIMRHNGFSDVCFFWLPILPGRFHHFQCIVESALFKWIFSFFPFIGALVSHSFILRGTKKQFFPVK